MFHFSRTMRRGALFAWIAVMLALFVAPAYASNQYDWVRLTPTTSPPAGDNVAIAYDAANNEIVMFTLNAETWVWDGVTWTQQFPAVSPPPAMWRASSMIRLTARSCFLADVKMGHRSWAIPGHGMA